MNRVWQHYTRKERERRELMDIIKDAREKGLIPPPAEGVHMV